jgi:lysyl-tRNA synthetase class 2
MQDWQPSASLARLKERADFLRDIRLFFAERQVIEVDPPLLCQGVATDPCLQAFAVNVKPKSQPPLFRYLQTSPEYAMKRLVAAGSGPIYSLGKAFRFDELGKKHNPEFTMLEWYRPGWDHHALIAEVDTLIQCMIGTQPAVVVAYAELFFEYFAINPHLASKSELQAIAKKNHWAGENDFLEFDKDGWLDLLMSHGIEPHLGQTAPLVVTDYPASQASLAQTRVIDGPEPFSVAERFEFYFKGIELANGYHELACAKEQAARFEDDLQKRKSYGLAQLPIDHYLLDALQAGFPPCAGVALGVDRLLMLKTGEKDIEKVIPFGWENA